MRQQLVFFLILMIPSGVTAQTAPAAEELASLLKAFLAGASSNDAEVHDRFWADDLIYTGSSGRRIGKADIMRDVRAAKPPQPDEPSIEYQAEDIRIQQYGDTAVVAFRLVATGGGEVREFHNSGTFLKRDGRWQVVCWQATRIPSEQPG